MQSLFSFSVCNVHNMKALQAKNTSQVHVLLSQNVHFHFYNASQTEESIIIQINHSVESQCATVCR